jgi:precorrin-6A/cobalt-precorrin-6A reductase
MPTMDSHRVNTAGWGSVRSAGNMRRHVLILGGTTEARQLGETLASRAELAVTLSLAGATRNPQTQAVPTRRGGFGGTEGLVRYLRINEVAALIDATHPYAATMSAHALDAASWSGIPMVSLCRPPWSAVVGDCWLDVDDAPSAAAALGSEARHVLLTIGRQEVAAFASAPQHHYLIRSVDRVEPPLPVPHAQYLLDRGPFTEAAERELMQCHGIQVLVAKNSGGQATYGKIAAARSLQLPVILLRRPPTPRAKTVHTVAEAVMWLDHVMDSPSDRGV